MDLRLQIPKNWQDFEAICHKLWREFWGDPNAQRNGRNGQAQNGVDVYGKPTYQGAYAGVQCKDKDGRLGQSLTQKELLEECQKATQFHPGIRTFSMATTAPRDEGIQEVARNLTQEAKFPFSVYVWSWDDIESEIIYRPSLFSYYYGMFQAPAEVEAKVHLSAYAPRENFYAFFSRPIVNQKVAPRLREYLIPLAYELSDNAYRHGHATQFTISIDSTSVVLSYDGKAFDPTTQLDATKVSATSHVGSFIFDSFLKTFKDTLTAKYSRVQNKLGDLNLLQLNFSIPLLGLGQQQTYDFPVDLSLAYGRGAAERLASSLPMPTGITDLVLTIQVVHNISVLVEFTLEVLKRLPKDVKLIVSLPRSDLLANVFNWINDSRLSVKMR